MEAERLLDEAREATSTPSEYEPTVLRGFFALTVALEVFAIAGLTLFLPVLLEQTAREHGFLAPDHVTPCPPSSNSASTSNNFAPASDEPARCSIRLITGGWLDTASYSLVTYSTSVLLQALTVISLGTRADQETARHRILVIFTAMGSVLCMLFLILPTSSSLWTFSALLTIGANVAFGASTVCLNAFLPSLAASSPVVASASERLYESIESLRAYAEPGSSSDRLALSQNVARAQEAYAQDKASVMAAISSRAIAAGYAAGIGVLVVMLVPVTLMKGSTFSLRVALFVSGLWWAALGTVALVWLRPAATSQVKETLSSSSLSFSDSVKEGWRSLGRMLLEWRRLPNTFVFLASWFLLSDSFSTITSTAMLFGKTTLEMTTSQLIGIAVLTPLSGMAGAFGVPRIQASRSWTNIETLRFLTAFSLSIPIWGLAGLRTKGEMYALAVLFGSLYGSFQAYSRTVFATLVPVTQSARWFGLYSITDKSSSFVGPLLVAIVTNATGQVRHGFWLILGMMALALFVPLALVDMEKGEADAERCVQDSIE